MIDNSRIKLRPVRRSDLARLQERRRDPIFESEFNNFGLTPEEHYEQRFERDGLLTRESACLVVETLDGQFLGDVSYHVVYHGPAGIGTVYNIGISLDPEQRGRGYGVEAQQLLTQYLFATYPIMRVEASTDSENKPEQRALEKAGFTREGLLRKAQWRGGAWHDMYLYSKLRDE